MKARSLFRTCVVTLATSVLALPATAGVITFDDIDLSLTNYSIPSGYGGFTWGDSNNPFGALDQDSYNYSYDNTVTFPSAINAAFSVNGTGITVTSATPFNFTGAYFAGWGLDDDVNAGPLGITSESVTLTGFDGTTQIGQVTMALGVQNFTWVSANFANVTSIRIDHSGLNLPVNDDPGSPMQTKWWLMDNFTYNQSTQQSVPDSGSTLALMAAGIAGLAALRRRKQA